jgi:hypothetical protein
MDKKRGLTESSPVWLSSFRPAMLPTAATDDDYPPLADALDGDVLQP